MSIKNKEALIDSRAIVHPGAELDTGVRIGPFSIIGPHVRIGSGTVVESHVVLEGKTTIGRDNRIFPYASVGAVPQDLKYGGEDSELVIGDNNTIRECVTINKGTEGGGGVTRLDSDILVMAYCHIAHDCHIKDGVIMANQATLAGHVIIENSAVLGGMTGIHQFCRIGSLAMVGAHSYVTMDVAPYTTVHGLRAKVSGLNLIGIKRKDISEETVAALKNAYRIIFKSSLPLEKAARKVRKDVKAYPEIEYFLEFIGNSERGVTR